MDKSFLFCIENKPKNVNTSEVLTIEVPSLMYGAVLSTVPPDYQYHNERQVEANQRPYSRNLNISVKKIFITSASFFHFGTEGGKEYL